MGKNISRKMRIATWSLQNQVSQNCIIPPHRSHGYSTDRIRTKNCKKFDQKLSKIGFVTTKIVENQGKFILETKIRS